MPSTVANFIATWWFVFTQWNLQLMFINVAAVIRKYRFPEYCNLATSVSCMQMIKVKITACEMYWNGLHLLKYIPDMTLQLPQLFAHLTMKRVSWIFIKKCWTKQNFEVRCLVTALFLAKEVAKYRKSTLWHA